MKPVFLCALLSAIVFAQGGADPDRVVSGNGKFPSGWSVRPDRGTADQVVFTQPGDVYHFSMGSAGTFYNAAWTKQPPAETPVGLAATESRLKCGSSARLRTALVANVSIAQIARNQPETHHFHCP
jgi:hypothetical protein